MHPATFRALLMLLSVVPASHSWNADFDYDGSSYYTPHTHSDCHDEPDQHHCNCIKLHNCLPIMAKLYAHPSKSYRQTVIKEIRKKACGFVGSDPLICCTSNQVIGSTEMPWIWNEWRPSKASGRPPFADNPDRRHPYGTVPPPPKRTSSTRRHFFDFEDPRTFRNCPRRLSSNFPMPPHIQHAKPLHGPHWRPGHFPADNENAIDDDNDWAYTHRPRPLYPNNIPTDPSTANAQDCGASIRARIIGGEAAAPGQFPWMARLAYRNRTSQLIAYRCLGSVVGSRYVVTAAHCIINLVEDLELVYVTLGDSHSRPTACERPKCPESNDYEIDWAITNPAYDTPKYANDIAVLRLRMPTAAEYPSSLCLPIGQYADENDDLDGGSGIVAGWGASISDANNTDEPQTLQQITLTIVNNTQCADFYARFSAAARDPIIIGDTQLCAQGTTNRDACQGDSGGPLMRIHRSGRYTLDGLVSFGPRQCGIPNFPGVYTRVSSYTNWIATAMKL